MSGKLVSKKRRNSTVAEPDSNGEARKQRKKTKSDDKSDPQLEFKVLQGYRDLESDMHKGRAHVARTGDIGVAMDNLDAVDSLFNKVIGIKNNGLFAHDARACLLYTSMCIRDRFNV